MEKQKGAVQVEELGKAPMDRRLVSPLSFHTDGEYDGGEALRIFCHQRSDSLKHHMLFPSLFCLPTVTAAIIDVSENVIFLGATVCHLKQAGSTLKQLTVLPSQVLAV